MVRAVLGQPQSPHRRPVQRCGRPSILSCICANASIRSPVAPAHMRTELLPSAENFETVEYKLLEDSPIRSTMSVSALVQLTDLHRPLHSDAPMSCFSSWHADGELLARTRL